MNVEAHNFKLKPTLISMVQQSQFGATPMEDPNLHLSVFLEMCDMLKLDGVSTNAICLHLLRFSLRDKAPTGSIIAWDELTNAFLAKFVRPSKTISLRNQITTFAQKDDETLYKELERFKDLLHLCPHHGLHNG